MATIKNQLLSGNTAHEMRQVIRMQNHENCPVNSYVNISTINIVFYVTIIPLCIFLGSASSFLLISGAALGMMHLMHRQRYRHLLPQIRTVQLAFCAFVIIEIMAALNNPSSITFNEVFENLSFLGLVGVFCLTIVPRDQLLRIMGVMAAIVAVIGALYILANFSLTQRIELSTGNPNVFALASTLLLTLNIAALQGSQGYKQLIFLVTSACALFLIIMSGSRVMWLAIILIALWSLFFTWRANKTIIVTICTAILVMAGIFLASQQNNMLGKRINSTMADLNKISQGDYTGSIGHRMQLYKISLALFEEKPWLGYGPGNAREIIATETFETYGTALTYSHAHNAFITAGLRAGILGLIGTLALFIVPLIVIGRGISQNNNMTERMGLFVMGATFIAYMCSGLTGLMVGHDIHDSLYIAITSYALYLRFGSDGTEEPA